MTDGRTVDSQLWRSQ